MKTTRREFLTAAGISAASLLGTGSAFAQQTAGKKASDRLKLGMASYTFRNFSMDEAVAMTKRLGLKHIAFKNMHLPYETPDEKIKELSAKVKNAGLDLYGCGVVYMKDEAEVNRAFDYAKAAGMRIIIGVPEHNLLELVNRKVKEYDIMVGIHNHGPGDEKYPSPQSVYDKVKGLDKRIGLCMDIGHSMRIGLDPSVEAERFADRLIDVHVKDVSAASKEGSAIEAGRGVIDLPKFFRTLLKIKYTGILALEYEKDDKDPLPGSAESIGYFNGILSVI